MFDSLFAWIEATALRQWIVGSPSLFAFPGILAAHTVGLGLLAGLNSALNLRLLGVAQAIPPVAFTRFFPAMWLGLGVNAVTGVLLLIGYPTKALTNPVFYLKLALIAVALVVLRMTMRRLRKGAEVSAQLKVLALISLFVWAAVITAGRLLAYTCSRMSVFNDAGC